MTVKFNFVGDVGLFRKFEELNIDPFEQISLPESDLNIGNFEFIVSKKKEKLFYDVQEQYSCSYDFASKLKLGTFAGFGLANNHSLDYQLKGVQETLDLLNQKKIKTFGFTEGEGFTTAIFETNGISTGLIACVKKGRWSKENFGYGPDTYEPEEVCKVIQSLKNKTDHVIVFIHWGTELVEVPDEEDTENAKKFIDSGAIAVIGHHPHICQGIEKYKNGLIAYSLGSFIYVHEEELGYGNTEKNRLFSICLKVELDKIGITRYEPVFYQYDPEKKIPVKADEEFSEKYSKYLNGIIYDRIRYKNQFRKVFLKRELRSFLIRFKNDPAGTLKTYLKLINMRRLKKVFSK